MERTKNLLMGIIRCELVGKELDAEMREKLDTDTLMRLFSLAKSHDLAHIVAAFLEKNELLPEGEPGEQFKKQKMLAMYRYLGFSREIPALNQTLEDAQIPFILLKGSILRKYYPEPWMRTSCDIDVFVNEEDIDKAVKFLTEDYGYKFDERTSHDVSLYAESGVHVELHFDLIEGEKTRSFLNNIWKNSRKTDGFEYKYEMNEELFVAYHIAHMAKHFEIGGCGIRPLLDLWIINQKIKYDQKTVNEMLEECQLCKFYEEATLLSEVWFADKEHTPLTIKMQDFIINAGSYGTLENRIAIDHKHRGGKLGYIFRRLFLPYSLLKAYYPRLEKHPILFPYYQVKRWINFIFRKNKKRALMELKYNNNVSHEKKNDLHALMSDLELM